jgi:hypothetical protein
VNLEKEINEEEVKQLEPSLLCKIMKDSVTAVLDKFINPQLASKGY